MPAQFDHLEASFSSKKLVQSSEPSCENYTVVVPLLKTRMKPLPSQLRMNHTSLHVSSLSVRSVLLLSKLLNEHLQDIEQTKCKKVLLIDISVTTATNQSMLLMIIVVIDILLAS